MVSPGSEKAVNAAMLATAPLMGRASANSALKRVLSILSAMISILSMYFVPA